MLLFYNRRILNPGRFCFGKAKSKKEKNFYQILEVPSNATQTSIKKNYFKLAKLYHPDVYKGTDKNRFQKIQEAYKVLSSQKERSEYDQTIGLKSNYQPEPQSPSDSTSEYGRQKNDFRYAKPKKQMNLDQQYEKFFKKKSNTHFQEIRLHQEPQFKAMSEKERIRRRFTEVYPDLNLGYKMNYSKSYPEVLDDQIKQKNRYEKDQKEAREKYEKRYSQQNQKKYKKYINVSVAIIFISMLPFIFSTRTKLRLQRKAREEYQNSMNNLFEDMQQTQIRERLKFK